MNIQQADGTYKMVAQTMHGLENLLAEEITATGGTEVEILKRAVRFTADQASVIRANLWSRTAIRISAELYHFQISGAEDLYNEVFNLPWSRLISDRDTFMVIPIVKSRYFRNTQFAAFKAKDAIVDNVRNAHGVRPSIDKAQPDFRISLKIHENDCSLLLDSSGDLLFKRGYRPKSLIAPINECLAAGMVLLSDWDKASDLLDPMCGSGTIAIEAGLIARNLPPNMFRKRFGFMDWPEFDQELFDQIKAEALAKQIKTSCKIYAFDKDSKAVELTKENAERAGLSDMIEVQKQDFFDIEGPIGEVKTLIMNPPYDERIGLLDAEDFYKEMGDVFKKQFTGCSAWLISANMTALKNVGLRPSRKIHLQNGPLESKFVNYQMYSGTKKLHKLDPNYKVKTEED